MTKNHTSYLQLPRVIGHRGACAYAPENTLSSFAKAAELSVPWVEFDVRLTADNELVLMHDGTVDRTSNGSGTVADLNYATLATLDAGSWFSAEFAAEKIPRLQDALTYLASQKMGINVELKAQPGQESNLVRHTLECIEKHWSADLPTPLLSSFSQPCMQALSDAPSPYPLGLLLVDWRPDWQQLADHWSCATVHMRFTYIEQDYIDAVKATGRYFLAYTVNDADTAKELFKQGVDTVFSNRPEEILLG